MGEPGDLRQAVGSLEHQPSRRQEEGRRERDFERFLTFLDAIVAIAVTLLVLPLVETAASTSEVSTIHLLRENAGEITGFFLSFFVIVQLWFIQHGIVRTVLVQDKVVIIALMIWALTVVVLPVPTAMVSETHEAGDMTPVVYIGTMAASSICLTVAAWRVRATPEIRDDRPPPDLVASLVSLAIIMASLLVSLVAPDASYFPLLALLLTGRITALIKSAVRV